MRAGSRSAHGVRTEDDDDVASSDAFRWRSDGGALGTGGNRGGTARVETDSTGVADHGGDHDDAPAQNAYSVVEDDLRCLMEWSTRIGLRLVVQSTAARLLHLTSPGASVEIADDPAVIDLLRQNRCLPVIVGSQFGLTVSESSPLDRALVGHLVALAGKSLLSGSYGGIRVVEWGDPTYLALARFQYGAADEGPPPEPTKAMTWAARRRAHNL